MIEELIKNSKKKNILTKFLTLEEQKELSNVSVVFSDIGYERRRAYIYNGDISEIDFKISVIEVNYNTKFYSLSHSNVLGALMGLGIKRDCVGDIIIDKKIYIIVIFEMTSFILNNLTTIDKATVEVNEVSSSVLDDLNVSNYYEVTIITTSLRLDVIVSAVTNLSREKAKEYINLKNIKVNGIINCNIDTVIKINDLISIHRYGRTILKEIVKKTKKDKFVLLIERTK